MILAKVVKSSVAFGQCELKDVKILTWVKLWSLGFVILDRVVQF